MEVGEVEGLERGSRLTTLTKEAEWVKRKVHIHKNRVHQSRAAFLFNHQIFAKAEEQEAETVDRTKL